MPTTIEQDLDAWVASRRRQIPAASFTREVMEAIQESTPPVSQSAPESPSPSWLVAFGCLLAGLGKLGLVFHLAF